jgi:hypothetical protein
MNLGLNPQLVEDILHAVAELRIPKCDGVIIDALKIPTDIFKAGGVKCAYYKRMVEIALDRHPAIPHVLVRWTAYGDCYLTKAV